MNITTRTSTNADTGESKTTATASVKKQEGLLSGIFARLAPLALLMQLQPIVDILKIFTSFVMLGLMKILQWLGIIKSDGDATKTFDPSKSTGSGVPDVGSDIELPKGKTIEDLMKEAFKNVDFQKVVESKITGPITDFGKWLDKFVTNKVDNFSSWLGKFVTGGTITHFGNWLLS